MDEEGQKWKGKWMMRPEMGMENFWALWMDGIKIVLNERDSSFFYEKILEYFGIFLRRKQ